MIYVDEKKLLKRFALSQKSETNLPSTSSGGIAGISFYRVNDAE